MSEIDHYRGLDYWGPLSAAKVSSILRHVALEEGDRAIDVGCGRGKVLLELAKRFGASVVGLDQSRGALDLARAAFASHLPLAQSEWIEGPVDAYVLGPEPFDLVSWIGGPYLGEDFSSTVEALSGWLAPQGYLLIGHGFWATPPPEAYLAATGIQASEFGEHWETIARVEEAGLRLQTCAVSTRDEWDDFEGTILANSERYAAEHPEAPDPSGRLQQRRDWNLAQQRWGRDVMGFGLYLFRLP
jgi:SAM-dependent methyltransferase